MHQSELLKKQLVTAEHHAYKITYETKNKQTNAQTQTRTQEIQSTVQIQSH